MANSTTASNNKTVLITGSNRGIGLALAQHYTNAGWRVIGTARGGSNTDKLKALQPFKIVTLESRDEESIARAAKELDGIKIDLLINNAGIAEPGRLHEATKESILRQFEVNAIGPFLFTRALLPNLKLASKGPDGNAIVVNISSGVGSIGTDTGFRVGYGYRVSKTALNMFNACLAEDLKEENITTIVLSPGYVATDMNGGNGLVQPEDSAAGIATVASKLTLEDTGKFFDYTGTLWAW